MANWLILGVNTSQWPRTSFCGRVGKVYNFVAALGKGYTAPMAALGRRLTNTSLRTSLPDMMIVRIPGTLPPKSHLVISPLPRRRKTEDSQFFPFLPPHCLTLFLSPLFLSLLLSDNNASPAAIMRQPYALHYHSFLCIFSIALTLPLYPIHRHRVLGYHTRSPTQRPLSDFTVTAFPLYSVLTHPDQTH